MNTAASADPSVTPAPLRPITASSVSAKMRRLGYRGMRSDWTRQGIHVSGDGPRGVTVTVDYDTPRRAARTAADIAESLNDAGYTVETNPLSASILRVTRKA